MPYPKNIETAKRVEDQIRKYGATPATICIMDGIIHIGINDQELDRFGKLGHEKKVTKCSRRDIALVCSQKSHGATTVSATMLLAHRFGIYVFVVRIWKLFMTKHCRLAVLEVFIESCQQMKLILWMSVQI